VLGELYLGTRELDLRTTKKITTPDDLKGLKLRMPDSPAWIFLGKALGANPTPLAFSELYLALQTGTVDGQDNPLSTDRAAKFYEVTKQIVLTNHLVDGLILCINDQTWNALSPDQQKVIQGAANAAIDYNNTNRITDEKSILDFFRQQGLQVYSPDVNAFRQHVLDAYRNDPISKDWPPNIIQKLDSITVASNYSRCRPGRSPAPRRTSPGPGPGRGPHEARESRVNRRHRVRAPLRPHVPCLPRRGLLPLRSRRPPELVDGAHPRELHRHALLDQHVQRPAQAPRRLHRGP
jgi:hypothetical protein